MIMNLRMVIIDFKINNNCMINYQPSSIVKAGARVLKRRVNTYTVIILLFYQFT